METKSLLVIGGGAAGFFCAVNAARLAPGLQVTIVERSSKLLSKVRVSGGGRCNVTQACFDITDMANRYPRGRNFVRKAFHRFFTNDTVAWFGERGVTLKTEADGRMFPVTDSSATIVNCLMREADRYGVSIMMNAQVSEVIPGSGWQVRLGDERILKADFLCIATGGYPRADQYGWLANTGHSLVMPSPSLFTFNAPAHPITKLMGVSVEDAEVRVNSFRHRERGPVLITHWGLSGPAVIRLSAWLAKEMEAVHYRGEVVLNWLPAYSEQGFRDHLLQFRNDHGGMKVRGKSPFGLPQRLWEFLLEESGVSGERWGELNVGVQNRLIRNLVSFVIPISGKTTFKEEFVTAGGIQTSEVDPRTMESRKHAGLYFAGEVLDVDGITGGYNFQHAWTSGFNAASAIAQKALT